MIDKDDVLTVEEAAEILKVTIDTVRRLLKKGRLPGTKIGREWRLSRKALTELIRQQGAPNDST
jgi:excisionase family DNA binding protein